MENKKFQIYINETYEEERVLVDITNDEFNVILQGGYYHNKINEQIRGFFKGLEYCAIFYNKGEAIYLNPIEHKELFEALEFYDGRED